MRPEDLRGEPSRDAREKVIDHARVDPVEDFPTRLLSRDELLDVLRYGGGSPFELLRPRHAVLPQKVELDRASVVELHMLDPQGRRPHGIGLVLLLLVADPEPKTVDKITDCPDLPRPRVPRSELLQYRRSDLPEVRPYPDRGVVLCLVPQLLNGSAFVEPDVLLLLRELVDPLRHPHRVVVVDDLPPPPRRYRAVFVEVQDDVPLSHPRLPVAPERVSAPPHEETRRLDKPVRYLHLLPVHSRVPVLCLQCLPASLPLGSQRLLHLLAHRLLRSLLSLDLLVEEGEVNLLELRAPAPIGEERSEVLHEVRYEVPVLDVLSVLLLREMVGHLLRERG